MWKHSTQASSARPCTFAFVDGVHAHARPRRVHKLRSALRELGICSALSRPRDGRAGQLVRFSVATWPDLSRVVDALESVQARLERVELALDFPHVFDLDAAREAFLRGLRLRDGSGAEVRPGLAVAYWAHADADVNLALYVDRPSKLQHGLWPAFHLELRLQGRALDRHALREPRELLRIDGREILEAFAAESSWDDLPTTLTRARA